MSSSFSQSNAPAPAPAAETAKVEEKNQPRRQMTQEQIDGLIRYQIVQMLDESFHRLSLKTKKLLAPAELLYQGNLPVPMGQLDDYVANILTEIKQSEARFMRERERILNEYSTKGYAEEQE